MLESDKEIKDLLLFTTEDILRKVEKKELEELVNELESVREEYVDKDEIKNNEEDIELTIDSCMGIDEENEDRLKGIMNVNEDNTAHMRLSEEDCTKIAGKIADRLAERKKLRVEAEEETEFKSKLKTLNETDTQYICMTCLHYSHSEKVPKSLKVYKVGTFGIFKKLDSTRRINKERRENIKKHFKNPLNQWCQKFAKERQKKDDEFRRNNMHACKKVVTNAVYCLKHSLSSADVVCLNDKDQLISPELTATKYDGVEQFFYFGDIVYEKLSHLIKDI